MKIGAAAPVDNYINFFGTDAASIELTRQYIENNLHADFGLDPHTTVSYVPGADPQQFVFRVTFRGADLGQTIQITYLPLDASDDGYTVNDLGATGTVVVLITPNLNASGTVLAPPPVLELAASMTSSSVLAFMADINGNGTPDTPVQSVRPLGSDFRVNTVTNGAQSLPSVGMDSDGNFTIAWQSMGQNLSFFNNIEAQRYDREGNRLGSEFMVNTADNTTIKFDPYVAMSHDGVIAIGWNDTNDPNYYLNGGIGVAVYAKVYDFTGAVLVGQFGAGGGDIVNIDFDSADNFVVSYGYVPDHSNVGTNGGVGNADYYATEYQLYTPGTHNLNFATIRPQFRINGANFDPNAADFWSFSQIGAGVVMDADGDLVGSYTGFGPDTSEDAGFTTDGFYGDVDQYITSQLVDDAANGESPNYIAWHRWYLEQTVGLLRGDPNAAMFSQFDADPNQGNANILTSDDVANNLRNGQNMTYLLTIDPAAISGNIVVRLSNLYGQYRDISITPVFYDADPSLVNPYDTIKVIHDALTTAGLLGIDWPETANFNGPFDGPVSVRLLSVPLQDPNTGAYSATGELADRLGTAWDPTTAGIDTSMIVYEITFMGEVHDTYVGLSIRDNKLKTEGTKVDEVQRIVFDPSPNGPDLSGFFTIQIGGYTSGPILFDSGDMVGTKARIQQQFVLANVPGITVTPEPGGPPYAIDVAFGGASSGIDQPALVCTAIDPMTINVVELVTGEINTDNTDARPSVFAIERYAEAGTTQYNASIAMNASGSLVMVWNQLDLTNAGGYNTSTLYFRTFQESVDTAGPLATDFILDNGTRVQNGATVNETMNYIVVSFDEDMMNTGSTGVNSVTNAANWALMKDGVLLSGGIGKVYYGMNEGYYYSLKYGDPNNPLPATNKWEAVIVLDGNGSAAGVTPLVNGHYQIVAKNSLRDKAGNALGRSGYAINGTSFSRDFNVASPTGSEIRVNNTVPGDQYTSATNTAAAAAPDAVAPNSQATASDANGDYIVVWTDATRRSICPAIHGHLGRRRCGQSHGHLHAAKRIRGERQHLSGRHAGFGGLQRLGSYGRRRRFRDYLDQGVLRCQRIGRRFGHLGAALRRQRQGAGHLQCRHGHGGNRRGAGQLYGPRLPRVFRGGHGRRRRLRHKLAEPEPG